MIYIYTHITLRQGPARLEKYMQKIYTQNSELPFTAYSYTEHNGLTKTDAKWPHHDIGDHGLEMSICERAFYTVFSP